VRAATVVLAIVAATSVAAAAPDAERVERARAAVLDGSYQKELPGTTGDEASGGSARADRDRTPVRDRARVDTRDDSELDRGPVGGIANVVLWVALVIAVALGVLWLGSELARGGGDVALADEPAPAAGPDLAVIERPLVDAEEHAKRGDFRAAIHSLLLRTLRELARASQVRLSPALTSREILARVPLAADAKGALGDLVVAVEVTHFGGDDATVDDYARCRACFDRFARAFRGAAA